VSNTANPIWSILGAGAIGSLWACYAQRSGHNTELIFRDHSSLAAYRQHGGIRFTANGQTDLLKIPARCPATIAAPIQQLLITTKAQQTLTALAAIAEYIQPDASLVLLQNGLGIAEQVQQQFPKARLFKASTTEGAYRPSRFAVVHAGRGQTLIGSAADKVDAIAQSLSFAPLTVSPSDNIDAVLWRKLAINCAINPLTVIHRCRNGELLDKPEALVQIASVVEEILQLSKILNLDQGLANLHEQVLDVARATANNRSSMLQDIESGKETEIEAITGYLCRLAIKHSMQLPTNEELLAQVKAITTARDQTL
jgi:2-dehydropantoate 2-reductase